MIIYKTTNLVNGKIYIGFYSGDRKSYLGSGVLIKKSIKKYGKDSFKRETSEETRKKMSDANIGKIISEETRKKISETLMGRKDSDEVRLKKSKSHKKLGIPSEQLKKMYDNNPQKIPVMIHNSIYSSISEASRTLNLDERTIKKRIHKHVDGYKYL